jgi:hypothetical protein
LSAGLLGAGLFPLDLVSDASAAPPVLPQQNLEQLSMLTSFPCNVGCSNLGSPDVMVRYGNNLNVALPPVVIHGVVHGGGPVSNTTIAAIFDAGQSKTFALTVAGLSPGVHELSTFATTNDGGALSGTSVVYFQVLPNGSLYIGETTDLRPVSAPTIPAIGMHRFVQTTFLDTLDFSVQAIVWSDVRNTQGQTVEYSTATIVPQGGQNATAYNVLFGLPPGTYHATIFATSVSSVAISNSTIFTFTIPSLQSLIGARPQRAKES